MYDVKKWQHVFKLDPQKTITDDQLEKVCESGTDAIIIGGTDGITLENVLDLMARVRRYHIPCILEISTIESVTPGFDLYFIPTVLNSKNHEYIVNLHQQAIKQYNYIIDWEEVLVEGYCVLNSDCKVAQLTAAETEIEIDDVVAYAIMAEKMFNLPIFYLEYSGKYGDPKVVAQVKEALHKTTLFYGGGIKSADQAAEMATWADVVVVGNIIYDDLESALTTVTAVRKIKQQ